jgi:hypothetical protein
LFSMTMVNTVPCQSGEGWLPVALMALQLVAVGLALLPQLPAAAAPMRRASVCLLRMCAKG